MIHTDRYVQEDDKVRKITLSLSTPTQVDVDYTSTATILVDDVVYESRVMHGVDSWQAFVSAYGMLVIMCESLLHHNTSGIYFDAKSAQKGEYSASLKELFGLSMLEAYGL